MWDNSVITNAGKALLERWAGGGTLVIDGASAGSGTAAITDLRNKTALENEKQRLSVVSYSQSAGGMEYKIQITPPTTGYTAKQIGVWGHIGAGAKTLIALYQDDMGVAVPSASEMADFVYAFYATIQGDNLNGSISVTVDTSAVVSETEFEAAIAKCNPMIIYSTLGVDTGNKWLDGKAIYRAVISGNVTAATGYTVVGELPSPVETPVSIRAYAQHSDGGWRVVPNAYHGDNAWNATVMVKGKEVAMMFGGAWSGSVPVVIIVEYTT